jgi:hypothetical protein
VKRYTKIVDYIINKLWEENVHFTYMYDAISPVTEEESVFSENDLEMDWRDIQLMYKNMSWANRKKYKEMLDILDKKYWNKNTNVSHILWWEYVNACITNHWNNLQYYLEEWNLKNHTINWNHTIWLPKWNY